MSLGGSQTQTTDVPDWVKAPAQRNLARAEEISQIGYVPYMGPEVAAFTGQQMAGFNNASQAANAFGMGSAAPDMPQAQTFAGGVQGYSSAPMFEQALQSLKTSRPGQYEAIMNQFINPYTGAAPVSQAADAMTVPQGGQSPDYGGYGDHGGSAFGGNGLAGAKGAFGEMTGGYTGLGDAVNGGGPGASGGGIK